MLVTVLDSCKKCQSPKGTKRSWSTLPMGSTHPTPSAPGPFKLHPGLLVPVSLTYAVGLLVSSCIVARLCLALNLTAAPELWTDYLV